MNFKKALGYSLLIFSAFMLFGCTHTNNPGGDDEFIRRPMEPDEFDIDTMTELPNDYTLVWADEFNYEGPVDQSKWNYEIGGGGWGNNELQTYTNSNDNSYVKDGHLTIKAIKNGNSYTSARLTSKNKGDFKYGRIEARMKLCDTRGTWPAFWMMPTDSVYGGWPRSGEIDIMEFVGSRPTQIFGTTHSQRSQGGGIGRTTSCPTAATDYNTYAIEWTENSIRFLLNNEMYFVFNRVPSWDYVDWPFDQDFFVILNLAIGGTLGGAVDPNFTEESIEVDYVRVYKQVDRTDNEKPAEVEVTNLLAGSSSATIAWDEPYDNQGIKHYEIVLNNKQIGATISRSYVVKNLEPNTRYNVKVIAVDYNDNWSISANTTIQTLSEQVVPGKILGMAFSDIKGDAIVTSTVAEGNVLQAKADSIITYNVNCNKSGNYSVGLRLAAMLNGELQIEVYSSTSLLSKQTVKVSRSYGSYLDIALTNKVNLPDGDISIVVTFASEQSGYAMQLSYIEFK